MPIIFLFTDGTAAFYCVIAAIQRSGSKHLSEMMMGSETCEDLPTFASFHVKK